MRHAAAESLRRHVHGMCCTARQAALCSRDMHVWSHCSPASPSTDLARGKCAAVRRRSHMRCIAVDRCRHNRAQYGNVQSPTSVPQTTQPPPPFLSDTATGAALETTRPRLPPLRTTARQSVFCGFLRIQSATSEAGSPAGARSAPRPPTRRAVCARGPPLTRRRDQRPTPIRSLMAPPHGAAPTCAEVRGPRTAAA
jgi:hypothetical protein